MCGAGVSCAAASSVIRKPSARNASRASDRGTLPNAAQDPSITVL